MQPFHQAAWVKGAKRRPKKTKLNLWNVLFLSKCTEYGLVNFGAGGGGPKLAVI